jgi:hypothetical protein
MPTPNVAGLVLDRGNPINRGLIVSWAMNAGAGRRVSDLAGGMDGLSNLAGWQGTSYGTGLVTSSSSVVTGQRPTLGRLPIGAAPRSIWWAGQCDSVTGWRWVGCYGHWNGNQGWMLGANGATLVGSTVFTDLTSASFWAVGKVTTVAYTYDGTTARLYGDGVLKASSTPTPNTVLLGVYAGQNTGGTELWTGVTNGMRIYDRALTAGEISQLHADPFAGVLAPLRSVRRWNPASVAVPPTPPTADRLWNRGYVGRIFRRGEKG